MQRMKGIGLAIGSLELLEAFGFSMRVEDNYAFSFFSSKDF